MQARSVEFTSPKWLRGIISVCFVPILSQVCGTKGQAISSLSNVLKGFALSMCLAIKLPCGNKKTWEKMCCCYRYASFTIPVYFTGEVGLLKQVWPDLHLWKYSSSNKWYRKDLSPWHYVDSMNLIACIPVLSIPKLS